MDMFDYLYGGRNKMQEAAGDQTKIGRNTFMIR